MNSSIFLYIDSETYLKRVSDLRRVDIGDTVTHELLRFTKLNPNLLPSELHSLIGHGVCLFIHLVCAGGSSYTNFISF